MFQNESLNTGSSIKQKEITVVDNIRETREILMKTSDSLERLRMFLKMTPEKDCCEQADTVQDFSSDVAGVRLIALKNLAKIKHIMDIIGLEE